eukprot:2769510-Rhodomonas_salina.1
MKPSRNTPPTKHLISSSHHRVHPTPDTTPQTTRTWARGGGEGDGCCCCWRLSWQTHAHTSVQDPANRTGRVGC